MKIRFKSFRLELFWNGIKYAKITIQKKQSKIFPLFKFRGCPCRTCWNSMDGMLGHGIGISLQIFGFNIANTRHLAIDELILREPRKLPYVVKIQKMKYFEKHAKPDETLTFPNKIDTPKFPPQR